MLIGCNLKRWWRLSQQLFIKYKSNDTFNSSSLRQINYKCRVPHASHELPDGRPCLPAQVWKLWVLFGFFCLWVGHTRTWSQWATDWQNNVTAYIRRRQLEISHLGETKKKHGGGNFSCNVLIVPMSNPAENRMTKIVKLQHFLVGGSGIVFDCSKTSLFFCTI